MSFTAKEAGRALGRFFTVEDLKGQPPLPVTIIKGAMEEVGDRKEVKPVLRFAETQKGLIVNRTRQRQLEGMFGANEPLEGKKIALTAGEERVNGRLFEMISIGPVS